MVHEELVETLSLYASGALDRAERQEIDTHLLTGCPVCHAGLKEFQAVAAAIPYALPPVAPPRPLKTKIVAPRPPSQPVAEIQRRPHQPSLEPGEWMKHLFPPTPRFPDCTPPVFGILGAVFIVSFLYMGYAAYVRTTADSAATASLQSELRHAKERLVEIESHLHQRDAALAEVRTASAKRDTAANELRETVILREAELDDLRNQLAQLGQDSAALKRSRAQFAEIATLFRSPTVRVIPMQGVDATPGTAGLVLYEPSRGKAFLYAYNLPPPPPGSTYQLWAIDVKPINAGIFGVDQGRKARLAVNGLSAIAGITKFAVTLETGRGATEPTGSTYLIGTP
ncbi:hypothetical protein YTPLAS18_16730 [Nitrospira sp.]|nr:hypothetical protein YTPLAS18_16730 [Nitrospira sp.]